MLPLFLAIVLHVDEAFIFALLMSMYSRDHINMRYDSDINNTAIVLLSENPKSYAAQKISIYLDKTGSSSNSRTVTKLDSFFYDFF